MGRAETMDEATRDELIDRLRLTMLEQPMDPQTAKWADRIGTAGLLLGALMLLAIYFLVTL